jgi:hypothetical protein
MNSDPAKRAWQSSVEVAGVPPLDLVHKGAGKLYRSVWWRNALEYAACAVIVVFFGWQALTLDNPVRQIGGVLSVAGASFVAWQLHRRASADHPDTAGTMPILQFTRAQLVRQRDALAGVLWWYLLPLAPGMLVTFLGTHLERMAAGVASVGGALLMLAFMLVLFGGVWWLNQLAARKLQRHIDEIDVLAGEKE